MKKAIMQVIYFRMTPLICCFLAILFYIEKKWLVIRNFATILPLKSKFFWKFQHFNANDGSVEMLKDNSIPKISIKIFYRAHTAINKIIQPPTRRKLPTSLEQKFYYWVVLEYLDICLLHAWGMQFLVN